MRTWVSLWAVLSMASVGVMGSCSFDQSGIAGEDGGGGGGVDGGLSADARVDAYSGPDAPPGCVTQCVGANQFRDCAAGGMVVDCPFGCVSSGGAHCGIMSPSNGADMSHLTGVSSGLAVPGGEDAFLDVDTGEIWVGAAKVRDLGPGAVNGLGFYELPGVNVFSFDFVSIGPDANVRIQGDKAAILLSRGAVSIEGMIDIAGGCASLNDVWCGGPGGGAGSDDNAFAAGCAPGGDGGDGGGDKTSGGGGGGLGQNGATGGGSDGGAILGGTGGLVTGACPGPSLVPLMGGSGGGQGGAGAAGGGRGGGGGGGLQISSYTSITIVDPAAGDPGGIWAGGAGGEQGADKDGGGGGGSGGAILLEAPSITIDGGVVAANGGGGGHGDGSGDGEYGRFAASQANGGGGGGRAGGKGGALGKQPGTPSVQDGAGGGGGGYGLVRFNVPAAALMLTSAVVSPDHTRGDLSVQ